MDSIFLNMPNLHFLPCNPVTSKVCSCFMHWLNMHAYQHVPQVQPPYCVAPHALTEGLSEIIAAVLKQSALCPKICVKRFLCICGSRRVDLAVCSCSSKTMCMLRPASHMAI